jgi:hypothetical protein
MSDKIKVAIKVRPLIEREEFEGLFIQWEVKNNSIFQKDCGKCKECYSFGKSLINSIQFILFLSINPYRKQVSWDVEIVTNKNNVYSIQIIDKSELTFINKQDN